MANRESYPAALFPNRGDISAEAGAVTTTVIGIQTTPVDPIAPTQGQTLIAISQAGVMTWTPESAGDWVMINSIPVSDDYQFGINLPIAASTKSPAVTINGV